jgi:rubredoxin
MLDEGRQASPDDGEFIEFVKTGATVAGSYRCSACGYGVTVRSILPRCPMCSGDTWEQAPWTPFAAAAQRRSETVQ